eukprot:g15479.t2
MCQAILAHTVCFDSSNMSHDLAGRPSLGTLDAPAQAACGVSSLQAQENWMGRKRFEQCAGYLVQVDVGLLRQEHLRPEETLPNKQISSDYKCGPPRRISLHNKEQLVKLQLRPKVFNFLGLGEVAVCLVVMDHSKMSHQHWTLVNYSLITAAGGDVVHQEENAPSKPEPSTSEPSKPEPAKQDAEVKQVEEIDSDIEFTGAKKAPEKQAANGGDVVFHPEENNTPRKPELSKPESAKQVAEVKQVEEIDSDIEFVDEPAAPMDAPHSLLDERELSSAIADAMIEQVLSILQRLPQSANTTLLPRLRPFIAYEVQQRLKSHSAEVPAMRRQISPMQRQHSPFQTLTGLAPSSLAGPLQEKIPLPRWMGDGGGGWKSRAGSVDSAHSLSQGEKGENAHAWEQSVEKIEKVLEERSSNTPKKLPKALSGRIQREPRRPDFRFEPPRQSSGHGRHHVGTTSLDIWLRHGSKSGDRSQSKMSQFSSTSGVIENRAKMKAARKAAMTLDDRHHVLPGLKEFVGEGLIPDAPPEPSRTLGSLAWLAELWTPKRKISVSMTRAVSSATRKPNAEFKQLPKTVSGAWRRQALSLAEEMRKDMAEEVAMAKTNMSFRRGLWWLRHLVGLRSMNRPYKAMLISFCLMAVIVMAEAIGLHGQIELHERTATAEMNHPFFRHVRNYGLVVSAGFGLLTHHFGVKFSDVGLPSGEQDELLQAHSVGMGYVQPWIFVSKRNSRFLGSAWMASMLFGAASEIYKTRLYPGTSAIQATRRRR